MHLIHSTFQFLALWHCSIRIVSRWAFARADHLTSGVRTTMRQRRLRAVGRWRHRTFRATVQCCVSIRIPASVLTRYRCFCKYAFSLRTFYRIVYSVSIHKWLLRFTDKQICSFQACQWLPFSMCLREASLIHIFTVWFTNIHFSF